MPGKIRNRTALLERAQAQSPPRISVKELKSVLHAYYHNDISDLINQDKCNNNEPLPDSIALSDAIALRIKVVCIPSTGQGLDERIPYSELHQIIQILTTESTSAYGGIYVGWTDHVLRCWVGRPLPIPAGEEPWPKPTQEDIAKAVTKLIKEIQIFL